MSVSIGELTGEISLEDRFSTALEGVARLAERSIEELEGSFKLVGIAALTAGSAITAMAGTVIYLGTKGSEINDLEGSFNRLAGSIENADNIMASLQKGTAGTIGSLELLQFANKALSAGAIKTADDFGKVSTAARVLSREGFGSVEQEMNTIERAMATGRIRQLQYMTGVIDLKKAETDYAKSLGTTRDQLTAAGKLHADQTAILDALNKKVQAAGILQESFAERIKSVNVSITDWFDKVASAVAASPNLGRAFDAIGNAITRNFGGAGQTAIEVIVGWVNKFADGVTHYGPIVIDWFGKIVTGIEKIWHTVTDAWDLVPDWFKNIAKDAALAALAIKVAEGALSGITGGAGGGVIEQAGSIATLVQGFDSLGNVITKISGPFKDFLVILKSQPPVEGGLLGYVKNFGDALGTVALILAGSNFAIFASGVGLVSDAFLVLKDNINGVYEAWKNSKSLWDFLRTPPVPPPQTTGEIVSSGLAGPLSPFIEPLTRRLFGPKGPPSTLASTLKAPLSTGLLQGGVPELGAKVGDDQVAQVNETNAKIEAANAKLVEKTKELNAEAEQYAAKLAEDTLGARMASLNKWYIADYNGIYNSKANWTEKTNAIAALNNDLYNRMTVAEKEFLDKEAEKLVERVKDFEKIGEQAAAAVSKSVGGQDVLKQLSQSGARFVQDSAVQVVKGGELISEGLNSISRAASQVSSDFEEIVTQATRVVHGGELLSQGAGEYGRQASMAADSVGNLAGENQKLVEGSLLTSTALKGVAGQVGLINTTFQGMGKTADEVNARVVRAMNESYEAARPLTQATQDQIDELNQWGVAVEEIAAITGVSMARVIAEVNGSSKALRDNLAKVFSDLPTVLMHAFEGGGNFVGAMKSLALQIGDVFYKSLTDAFKKAALDSKSLLNKTTLGAAAGLGATTGLSAAASGASLGQQAGAAGGAAASVAEGVFAKGGFSLATLGTATALSATTFGTSIAASLAYAGIKKLFEIGGPSKTELAGRSLEKTFQDGFKSLEDMTNQIGKAYATTGQTLEQARIDVKALLDAEKQGPAAVQAIIDKLQGALDRAKEIDAAISGLGITSHDELMHAADIANAAYEKIKAGVETGQFTVEDATKAYRAYQQALADAGDEAAKTWLKVHKAEEGAAKTMEEIAKDAGYATRDELKQSADEARRLFEYMRDSGKFTADQIKDAFEKSQDAAHKAMGISQALIDKQKELQDAVNKEAPEEVMGSIEAAQRKELEGLNKQIDGVGDIADAQAEAAKQAGEDWKSKMRSAASETETQFQTAAEATTTANQDAATQSSAAFQTAATDASNAFAQAAAQMHDDFINAAQDAAKVVSTTFNDLPPVIIPTAFGAPVFTPPTLPTTTLLTVWAIDSPTIPPMKPVPIQTMWEITAPPAIPPVKIPTTWNITVPDTPTIPPVEIKTTWNITAPPPIPPVEINTTWNITEPNVPTIQPVKIPTMWDVTEPAVPAIPTVKIQTAWNITAPPEIPPVEIKTTWNITEPTVPAISPVKIETVWNITEPTVPTIQPVKIPTMWDIVEPAVPVIPPVEIKTVWNITEPTVPTISPVEIKTVWNITEPTVPTIPPVEIQTTWNIATPTLPVITPVKILTTWNITTPTVTPPAPVHIPTLWDISTLDIPIIPPVHIPVIFDLPVDDLLRTVKAAAQTATEFFGTASSDVSLMWENSSQQWNARLISDARNATDTITESWTTSVDTWVGYVTSSVADAVASVTTEFGTAATSTQTSFNEAALAIKKDFEIMALAIKDAMVSSAQDAAKQIEDTFANVSITIPINWDVQPVPTPPTVPTIPTPNPNPTPRPVPTPNPVPQFPAPTPIPAPPQFPQPGPYSPTPLPLPPSTKPREEAEGEAGFAPGPMNFKTQGQEFFAFGGENQGLQGLIDKLGGASTKPSGKTIIQIQVGSKTVKEVVIDELENAPSSRDIKVIKSLTHD